MKELFEKAKLKLSEYDILKKINDFESWRSDFADPEIKKAILDITNIYTQLKNDIIPNLDKNISDITDIYNNLKDNIVPKINSTAQLANSAYTKSQDTLTLAQQVQANVQQALADAQTSIAMAIDFFNRFKTAGTSLRNDMLRIKYAANDLLNLTKVELVKIADAFKTLGNNVGDAAGLIYNAALDVGSSIVTAYNNIKIPVNRAKEYFDKVQNPNLFDLLLTFYNIFMAFSHLTLLPYGGKQGAFIEVVNGFSLVSTEFKDLGNSFLTFGNTVQVNAPLVYNTIIASMDNITNGVNKFLDTISLMTTNLSTNLSPSA